MKDGVTLSGDEPLPKAAGSEFRALNRIGDYELLEEIARGGMGIVYRARQVSLHRVVAVKLLPAGSRATEERVARFQVEAAAAAALRHPNIVAIHAIGVHEGQWYFSMDFVDGQSLADLAGGRPVASRRAAEWLKQVAEAVHFAHSRGLIHRDLKPANILVDPFGQPRITDFGLAKWLGVGGQGAPWDSDLELTGTGEILGTPSFMSPEQTSSKRGTVGVASDVYSLGAVLYYLLTGRAPFQAESLLDTLEQVRDVDPIRPRRLNRSVPRDLEIICLKCLEKSPAQRYRTAEELALDLGRFLNDRPIEARECGVLTKTARWCRRQPALAALIGLCLAVAGGGILWTLREWREAEAFARRQRSESYAREMKLADVALGEDHFRRVRTLLDRHVPTEGEEDSRGFEWYYLWNQSREPRLDRMQPHDGLTVAMDVSPDSRVLATASFEGQVGIWDYASRRAITNFPVKYAGPRRGAMAFSGDGTLLAVHEGDRVRLWRCADWTEMAGPSGELWMEDFKDVRPVCFLEGDRLLLAKFGGEVVIWDVRAERVQGRLIGDAKDFGYLMVPLTEGWVAVATGNTIQVWDLLQRTKVKELQPGLDQPNAIAFCPVRGWLACGDRRGEVVIWGGWGRGSQPDEAGDAAGSADPFAWGRFVGRLSTHNAALYALAFSPDGRHLLGGGREQRIRVWTLDRLGEFIEMRGRLKSLRALRFLPDGKTLVSSDIAHELRFWAFPPEGVTDGAGEGRASNGESRTTGSPAASTGGASAGSLAEGLGRFARVEIPLGYSESRDVLVALRRDFSLGLYQPDSGVLKQRVDLGLRSRPKRITASSHATWVAFRDDRDAVRLWNLEQGAVEEGWDLVRPELQGMAFSPDERALLLVNLVGCEIWNVATRTLEFELKHRMGPGFDVAPNHRWVAIVDREEDDTMRTVSVWDWRERRLVRLLRGHQSKVMAVAFSPDFKHLATASWDETIRLYDLGTGDLVGDHVLYGHKEPVLALAFSGDGRTLASSASDGTVRLWSVLHGQELVRLEVSLEQPLPLLFFHRDQALGVGTGWAVPASREARFFLAPRGDARLVAAAGLGG